MSGQKGLAPLILLPIILLGLVAVYFIYGYSKSIINTPTSQPTSTSSASVTSKDESANPDLIGANWKTYTNPALGFSFLYPKELNYLYDQFGFNHPNNPEGNLLLQNYNGSNSTKKDTANFQIIINAYKNVDKITLEKFVKDPNKVWNIDKNQTFIPLMLNSKIAFRGESIQKGERVPTVWVENNGYILTITLSTPESTNAKWFDQILSTFKFTDQTQSGKISPNGSYIVSENIVGDYNTISIKDKQGNVLISDLIKENEKEIGYNTKFKCQCGTSFKGWINDSKFTIKIVNGGGEEYEYTVDAKTGKVDEASFKRIK